MELADDESLHNCDAMACWGDCNGAKILSVGNLKKAKNQALLIDAFEYLQRKHNATLVILGEGPQRSQLEHLIEAKGLGDRIRLPGFREDLVRFYRTADLFVLSSDREGFGNVIVEARSFGLPDISTDCPTGPGEILVGGKFGTFVPCGDRAAMVPAMEAALASKHDCQELKRRASEFAPPIAAEKYLEVLLRTVSNEPDDNEK